MIRMSSDEAARVRYEAYCARNGVDIQPWAKLEFAFKQQWAPPETVPERKPMGRAECEDATSIKQA